MKRIVASGIVMALLFLIGSFPSAYSEVDTTHLTPEKVVELSNQDMVDLYGKLNYFPDRTGMGPYRTDLLQSRIA